MSADPACQAPHAPTGAVPRTCVPFAHVPAVPVVAVPYVPVPIPSGLPVMSVSGVLPDRAGNVDVTQFLDRWAEGALSGKADKAVPLAAGSLAALAADGNLADSGKKPADFAGAAQFAAHKDNTTIHIAAAERSAWNAKYDKPSGGIPKADLAQAVKDSLGRADTAVQTHQSLDAYVNAAGYDSTAKEIQLKHDSTVVARIDATAFIKDGMVDLVEISGGNLVISFNTDAGVEDIEIPLTGIFNPSNYYDKTAADGRFVQKEAGKGLVAVDQTLTTQGAAADAKAVGDALRSGFTPWVCNSISEGNEFVNCEWEIGSGWVVTIATTPQPPVVPTTIAVLASVDPDAVKIIVSSGPVSFSLSRHLITPTKTSQLTNDGASNGGGNAYVMTNDSRLTNARTPTAHHVTHAANGSDPLAPSDIGAASASDLPYRLVEPGKWEFSDSFSHVIDGPIFDGEYYWYYIIDNSNVSQFFETEADALAALSLTFDAEPAITATRVSLPGHLLDRAGNRVVVTGDTTLTLPAAVEGYARDFLVRLEISGSTVPTITFAAPTGETLTYETDGDEFPVPDEAGNWLYSFTESCVSHKFAVALKKVNEVAQVAQGGS